MARAPLLYAALAVVGAIAGYLLVRSPDSDASSRPAQANTVVDTSALAAVGDDAGPAGATDAGGLATPSPAQGPTKKCPSELSDSKGALVEGSDAFLEQRMQWLLADYGVPEGAVVVLEPKTGQLLAATGYIHEGKKADRELAVQPRFLAASIFKIVSAAAMLANGVSTTDQLCYSGGLRSVSEQELKDNAKLDNACTDVGGALAKSLNVPFAKWADRKLNPSRLGGAARDFGFSVPMGEGSRCFGGANIPTARLDFARTAAGFGDVRLSAWHAAWLTAVVANRGALPSPAEDGGTMQERILSAARGEQLAKMMARTVSEGTARRAFYERGRYTLGQHSAAGKTGSLVEGKGDDWREATWFVGFAPVDKPQVAVAAVLQNTPTWRIRAAYVGREALRTALLRTSPYRPTQDRVRRRTKKKRSP